MRVLEIQAVGEGGWKRRGGYERGEEKARGGDEEEWEGGANERLGWGGGTVFLAMQVLEIPAGGRGFPLVQYNSLCLAWGRASPIICDQLAYIG